jgi:cob(I)alamin adenosyltransferase
MIRINKVTTKTGDSGNTLGPDNKLTPKSSCNIKFLGNLDELNVLIGESILYSNNLESKEVLEKIQHQLFDIGGMFYSQNLREFDSYILFLENNIEKFNKDLPELTSFLLPKGTQEVISLHKARTKARETERTFFSIQEIEKVSPIGIYLNRLSDLMFIFIRKISTQPWKPFEKY